MNSNATASATSHPRLFVRKVLVRTAYARNGNAHNPTKTYGWHAELLLDDGRMVSVASYCRTRKMAIEIGLEAMPEFGIA